jgi:hypothetical protein
MQCSGPHQDDPNGQQPDGVVFPCPRIAKNLILDLRSSREDEYEILIV